MPVVGGVFIPSWQWVTDAISYPNIQPDRFDIYMNDQATAINLAVFRDGTNNATANLPMAGFRHLGVGNATARDQYLTLGQFQDSSGLYYVDSGAANAYVITPAPAVSGYSAGQTFKVKVTNANTGASTINVNGLGVKSLVKGASTPLVSGDLIAGKVYFVTYDGTNFQVEGIIASYQFADNLFRVTGSVDATKLLALEVDGFTTGTTRTKTLQDISGTLYETGGLDIAIADGGTGQSTALAAFDALKQASTDTYTGVVELATAAEVKTATDTTRATTPASLGSHPGMAKAWIRANAAGSISASYNITSVVKNGTGDFTLNFTNAMADVNYVPTGWGIFQSGLSAQLFSGNNTNTSLLTGSARIQFSNSVSGALIDPVSWGVVIHGN